jgi:hypothetical protein
MVHLYMLHLERYFGKDLPVAYGTPMNGYYMIRSFWVRHARPWMPATATLQQILKSSLQILVLAAGSATLIHINSLSPSIFWSATLWTGSTYFHILHTFELDFNIFTFQHLRLYLEHSSNLRLKNRPCVPLRSSLL